ncbi:MAG: hypothetical protein UT63_C0022G0003 [Candidatus Gottesmanbacteria bacterium GW2011_GWC2_39_8]|uniref:Cohesin domain-containing protein n=1 Tax=Candidatus Gottesmanbacteria bacterium GW2011_GWC2_39_8 TaxID=1618450 RepID=A0A0G0SEN7_9BACT|nr:MAG: hypothetical protein UT63_C0022G0003 [Candidatus Gottesmanbacteria bacterium GW2011_GWC2_39_8]
MNKFFDKKVPLINIFVLLVVSLSLILGVVLVSQKTGFFELRRKAGGFLGSTLGVTGPTQAMVGDIFNVELILDTATDYDYTISGVDGLVEYSDNLQLTAVNRGSLFDEYPNLANVIGTNPAMISGVKNYNTNENGWFKGFTGNGTFATLSFIATRSGPAYVKLVHKGAGATDDSNINGFLANQPVSLQKTQDRLYAVPLAYNIDILENPASPPNITTFPFPSTIISIVPVTVTPAPQVTVNIKLNLEGKTDHSADVDIYALDPNIPIVGPMPSMVNKIGTARINDQGYGPLVLNSTHIGKSYYLFAKTKSYLSKRSNNHLPILLKSGTNPVCSIVTNCTEENKYVIFGTVLTGDINGDDLINTADIAEMYSDWNKASVPSNLNGDETVNNRDLALLYTNFSKKGDMYSLRRGVGYTILDKVLAFLH